MTASVPCECTIKRARSIADYLFLRNLRNSVREQMTNDQTRIGLLQQARFYLTQPPHIEVYIAFVNERRAGYLLLRQTPTTCLITEAVSDRFRRQGVGAQMIAFAQDRFSELTADILITNVASIRLHESAGFRYQRTTGSVATYQYCTQRS